MPFSPPPFLPLFHASDGRFSLSDQQKYGKFQREEGSRRARRNEGQQAAASRPAMRSESAAHSVTYTRVPRLSLLLRSEGAAFKASVLKSVVKRFQVGLRNFEAERERRRRGGGGPKERGKERSGVTAGHLGKTFTSAARRCARHRFGSLAEFLYRVRGTLDVRLIVLRVAISNINLDDRKKESADLAFTLTSFGPSPIHPSIQSTIIAGAPTTDPFTVHSARPLSCRAPRRFTLIP